jgi:hypothetical protein
MVARRCGLRWIAPAALAAMGGCSIRPPVATVGAALVSERTAEAARIDVAVEVVNRADVPIELLDCAYRLSAEGEPAYEGRRAVRLTVMPKQAARIALPAVVTGAAPAPAWRIEGRLWFLGPGELEAALHDLGLRRPNVTFHGDGAFPPG